MGSPRRERAEAAAAEPFACRLGGHGGCLVGGRDIRRLASPGRDESTKWNPSRTPPHFSPFPTAESQHF